VLPDAHRPLEAPNTEHDEPLARHRLAVGKEVRLGAGGERIIIIGAS